MAEQQENHGQCRIVWTIPEKRRNLCSKSFKIGENDNYVVVIKKRTQKSDECMFYVHPIRACSEQVKIICASFYLLSPDRIEALLMEDMLTSTYSRRPTGDVFVCDLTVSSSQPYTEKWIKATNSDIKETKHHRINEIAKRLNKSYPTLFTIAAETEGPDVTENPISKISAGQSSAGALLSKSLTNSYKKKQFCDITIKVQRYHEIRAHKVVLVSGSTVWRRLLTDDEHLSIINVPDLDYQTVEALVFFIYHGTVPHSITNQLLYIAADTYGVTGLKAHCEQQLIQMITIESTFNLLEFAFGYNAPALFDEILTFMRSNIAKLQERDDWESMFCSNPQLAMEVVKKLLKKIM